MTREQEWLIAVAMILLVAVAAIKSHPADRNTLLLDPPLEYRAQ